MAGGGASASITVGKSTRLLLVLALVAAAAAAPRVVGADNVDGGDQGAARAAGRALLQAGAGTWGAARWAAGAARICLSPRLDRYSTCACAVSDPGSSTAFGNLARRPSQHQKPMHVCANDTYIHSFIRIDIVMRIYTVAFVFMWRLCDSAHLNSKEIV
uniref:Uncharacterized protein n=1 Tax=Oryza brachyantha TaxID=4533 RepID=J3LS72_ORYBR